MDTENNVGNSLIITLVKRAIYSSKLEGSYHTIHLVKMLINRHAVMNDTQQLSEES